MFNSSRNAALHPNQGHAADALFICGIPGRHAKRAHTHSQTDTCIWHALARLVCLQQQNRNSAVGYYEWEWESFSFFLFAVGRATHPAWPASLHTKHTWRISAHYPHTNTHTCSYKHWEAWRWYRLGRKSLKCPSQAPMICSRCDHMMMDGEMEKWKREKKRTSFSPINSSVPLPPPPPPI